MRVYLQPLGCPKNDVDAEVMLHNLSRAGYDIVGQPDGADIIIVNTCGFILDAAQESVDAILELAEYKQRGCRLLVVSGCLSQRYNDTLMEQLPEVDLMLGVTQYPMAAKYISQALEHGPMVACTPQEVPSKVAGRYRAPDHFAYLKIAEGCDNFCTYCAIPYIRGRYVSRQPADILDEARMLIEQGVREICLVAQDTTRYGMDAKTGMRLAALMQKIAGLDGLEWLRVMYCYPELVDDALLETIAGNEKICNYMDLPLQHIDDGVLRAMGRRSSEAQIRALIPRVQRHGIALRTTFIVGFPGETRQAAKKLVDFAQDAKFHHMGAFMYSAEDGTPAALMPQQVPKRTQRARHERLMLAQQAVSRGILAGYVGREMDAVVDGEKTDQGYPARLAFQSRDIDSQLWLQGDGLAPGQFVRARITGSDIYDLTGVIL